MRNLVDKCLTELIKTPRTLQLGIPVIQDHLKSMGASWAALEKEVSKAYRKFEKWLLKLIQTEPIPEEIVALNFGLFESEHGVQLYVSGSEEWDEEDSDWASNHDYFPDDGYWDNDFYARIGKVVADDEDTCIYLSLATTSLFAMTFIQAHPYAFQEIYVATGFDDGDLYGIWPIQK